MDSTLHALGGILLNGLPTFLLIIVLNVYLKAVFFQPLEHTLARRYQAIEGARKAAQDALANAQVRIAEYEAALRAERARMYESQERLNRRLQEEHAAALHAAREDAERAIRRAQAEITAEVGIARQSLSGQSEALANQIADSILVQGRAA